ncbi:unnamed protein product [Tilletia caries]|nr:unnamed protein product [Tilletia caries]
MKTLSSLIISSSIALVNASRTVNCCGPASVDANRRCSSRLEVEAEADGVDEDVVPRTESCAARVLRAREAAAAVAATEEAPTLQARAGGTHVTETEMRRFVSFVQSGRIPEYAKAEYERLATMGINRLQEEQRLRAQLHAEGYTDLDSLPAPLRQQYLRAQNQATQASLDFSGHVQKWLGNA